MSEETNNNVQPEVQTQEPEQPPVKEKKTFGKKLDNYFGISKAGSSIGTEIVAGIVTFLAMAYILVVNPNAILSSNAAATEWSSVFLATAFGAVIGTVLMAFVAKMPLAQASGMGLNYTVGAILGGSLGFAVSYGNVMLLVLISGLLFLLLSVIKVGGVSVREKIFDGIPECVRGAIAVGIGLFIAFIGMQNAGLIVSTYVPITGEGGVFLFGIPGAAASSALLYVGCLMLKGIKNVKIDTVKNAVPAFLTIAMMPLAYSITDGIGFGILSYVIIDLIIYIVDAIKSAVNKKKGAEKPVWDLHVVTIIVAVLFLVYFFVPTTF